ncbi:hypothetical protein DB42_AB00210 [Neochlamydia sp. EPS4]|uniref:hypothetical protein n=1 Tax=Neochlamydia sp. EPS4 TaxID=1478175 RepID=UPI000583F516|nr:hypothetical protein [Neochlamydia sp. EPS4]KIC75502.1 hypothetical protein DB42_AB00210 [Neochlamydia sp. EPS4]
MHARIFYWYLPFLLKIFNKFFASIERPAINHLAFNKNISFSQLIILVPYPRIPLMALASYLKFHLLAIYLATDE